MTEACGNPLCTAQLKQSESKWGQPRSFCNEQCRLPHWVPKPGQLYCWRQSTRRVVGKYYKVKPGSLTAELLTGRSIDVMLFAAQLFTFLAESMIRWPDARNDEVKAFRPVGTSTAEMPDVATRVC